jgi:hypothetical protein
LTSALPLAALAWVAYQVVVTYWRAARGSGTFLGTPFAIHSGLLLLVAWAVPFLLDRMLRPSLERVVAQALRQGFAAGLEGVRAELHGALREAAEDARRNRAEAETLRAEAASVMLRPLDARDPTLARLIAMGGERAGDERSGPSGQQHRGHVLGGGGKLDLPGGHADNG